MASFQNLQSMPEPTITQSIIEGTSHNMEVAVAETWSYAISQIQMKLKRQKQQLNNPKFKQI